MPVPHASHPFLLPSGAFELGSLRRHCYGVGEDANATAPHMSWRDPIGGVADAIAPPDGRALQQMLQQTTSASSGHVTILELVASFLPATERHGLFGGWSPNATHWRRTSPTPMPFVYTLPS